MPRRAPAAGPQRRRRLVDARSIAEGLDRGDPIRLLLRREGAISREAEQLMARLETARIPVLVESEREMRRMSPGDEAAELIGVVGVAGGSGDAVNGQDLDSLMTNDGLVIWLVGLRYPGNVGFILRTAEVSGVGGIVLTNDWQGDQFAEALRVGMRADRFMPIVRAEVAETLAAARRAGRHLLAIETSGDRSPWESDLTRAAVWLIGGETQGIPAAVLREANEIIRLPTPGFVPSYNVQAAVGMLLGEWLRQNLAPTSPEAGLGPTGSGR